MRDRWLVPPLLLAGSGSCIPIWWDQDQGWYSSSIEPTEDLQPTGDQPTPRESAFAYVIDADLDLDTIRAIQSAGEQADVRFERSGSEVEALASVPASVGRAVVMAGSKGAEILSRVYERQGGRWAAVKEERVSAGGTGVVDATFRVASQLFPNRFTTILKIRCQDISAEECENILTARTTVVIGEQPRDLRKDGDAWVARAILPACQIQTWQVTVKDSERFKLAAKGCGGEYVPCEVRIPAAKAFRDEDGWLLVPGCR